MTVINSFRIALLLGFCAVVFSAYAKDSSQVKAELLRSAQAAATSARSCQHYLHDDADEFEGCIDGQLRSITKSTNADAKRIGVLYFAFAGALNSARVSLPGAEEAARNYARSTVKLKKKLKLSDADLCSLLEGDCAARSAVMSRF